MIKHALQKLADRTNLTTLEADTVMGEIMDGTASHAQIAAYLMGLRMKGETVDEIAGSVQAMRARATKIRVGDSQVVDTCGTGGDGAHTFNISTTAAFVVAGAGLTVAKHGIARYRPSVAVPTCWRRWVSGSTCRPSGWRIA